MAGVRRNVGYYLSKYNMLKGVNDLRLAAEFAAKNIQCEVPGCEDIAFAIIKNGVVPFVCPTHFLEWDDSKKGALHLKIMRHLQAVMLESANAAWEDSSQHSGDSFNGEGSILDSARNDAGRLYSDAPKVELLFDFATI